MPLTGRSLTNLTGLILSVACVLHCILMPLCLASLPSWGLTWLSNPLMHKILALLGVGIGLWALWPGWKLHRRHAVLLWASVGLSVMNYAAFASEDCCAEAANVSRSENPSVCCEKSCCLPQIPVESTHTAKQGSGRGSRSRGGSFVELDLAASDGSGSGVPGLGPLPQWSLPTFVLPGKIRLGMFDAGRPHQFRWGGVTERQREQGRK